MVKDVKIKWFHVGGLAGFCGSINLQKFIRAVVVFVQVEIPS